MGVKDNRDVFQPDLGSTTSDRTLSALVTSCGVTGGWVLAEIPGMGAARNIFRGVENVDQVLGRIVTNGKDFVGDGRGDVFYSDIAGYQSLVDQLAQNFANREAVLRVGGAVVGGWQKAGRVVSGEPYKAGLANLVGAVSEDLDKSQLKLVVESLERCESAIDNKRIMCQTGLDMIHDGKVGFVGYDAKNCTGRGVVAFVWKGGLGRGIVGKDEVSKASESLARVFRLFRLDQDRIDKDGPVRHVILPNVLLRNYSYADMDMIVVLSAGADEWISGKNVLDQRTCDHEHVHFVLYRLFKKYPPVPDLIEGVADGVAYYLAGERYEKEKGWGIVLNRAVEKMKVSPAATKLSGTRLLEEEGGNLYLKAYEMRVLVGTLAAMFPKSWVEVVKEMYRLSCEENLTDRGGRLLIANGQKVLGVQNRELLFGLLAGGLMKARGEEKQRWLGDLNRAGVGIRNDILAELVEVVAEEKRRSGKRK